MWRSDWDGIEYKTTARELPENIAQLFKKIELYDYRVRNALNDAESDANDSDLEKNRKIAARVEKANHESWNEFAKLVPDMGEYSPEHFKTFIVYKLPRIAATYGYHVEHNQISGIGMYDKSRWLFIAHIAEIYPITDIGNADTQMFGETLAAPIIKLDRKNARAGHDVSLQFSKGAFSPYKFLYGNIIVTETDIPIESITAKSLARDDIPALRESLERATGEEQIKVAVRLATHEYLDLRRGNSPTPEENGTHALIHELGHMRFDHVPKFREERKKFIPHDLYTDQINMATINCNHEAAAFLAELRYAPKIENSFEELFLTLLAQKPDHAKLTHEGGARYVIAEIFRCITENPKAYGFTLDPASHLELKSQMILQLPKLMRDRDRLNPLVDEVWKRHIADPCKDFSDIAHEATQFQKPTKPFVIPDYVYDAGGLLTAAAGAYYLFNKSLERRTIGQVLGIIEKHAKNPDATVAELQLWESTVDDTRRQTAIKRLIEESTETPELLKALGAIRPEMMSKANTERLGKRTRQGK